MRINALGNTATNFANDDFIVVDGATNGSRKMAKNTLLQKTANNSLANNVSPEFDENKPNDAGGYAYYAGDNVTYNGKNYVFISNHFSGPWNALEVEQKPISETISLSGVGEAVENWLNEHPEATTTVEDGSLTEQKFSSSLKTKAIKDYITPEMFGAVGDGVEDDTNAINDAITFCKTNNGKTLVFSPKKIYGISSQITLDGSFDVFGYDSEIRALSSMSNVVLIDKTSSILGATRYRQQSCLFGVFVNGNTLADVGLFVKQGKAIKIRDVYVKGALDYTCKLGSSDDLWEVEMANCTFNANNENGQANYPLYMTGTITDSSFTDLLLINGQTSWAHFKCASSWITNVHGYAYPEELKPNVGFEVDTAASSVYFKNIVADTFKKKAIECKGQSCVFENCVCARGDADEALVIGIDIQNSNCTIRNLFMGGANACGVYIDRTLYPSIDGVWIENIRPIILSTPINKDVDIVGKVPYYFNLVNQKSGVTSSYISNEFFFINQYVYSDLKKAISFKNELSNALYTVDIFDIVEGRKQPSFSITNKTTTGFTINILETYDGSPLNLTVRVKPYWYM